MTAASTAGSGRAPSSTEVGRGWSGVAGPAALLLLGTASCSGATSPGDSVACRRAAVLYGGDDRVEPRDAATGSPSVAPGAAVAVIQKRIFDDVTEGRLTMADASARATYGLCEGERFGDQPALGDCSGTLLAPDLVLTAAHCLGGRSCESFVYVSGFEWAGPDSWPGYEPGGVARCAEVVHRVETVDARGAPTADFVLIRLATPLPRSVAFPLQRKGSLRTGDRLVLAGHPFGVPLKLAEGHVVDPRSSSFDYFGAELDSYGGNSGAPVFDAGGALVGMMLAGQTDFERDDGADCLRSAQAKIDVPHGKFERVAYLDAALDAACTAGLDRACAGGCDH